MKERKVTVAATQMTCSWDIDENIGKAESLVRKAAESGANIILIQELFSAPYFCKDQLEKYFDLAEPVPSLGPFGMAVLGCLMGLAALRRLRS